jgi:outer membrane protein OmpA-like peptidoglycan-associated protein
MSRAAAAHRLAGATAMAMALPLAGCAGAEALGLDIVAVHGRLQDAARAGAHLCAPRELALARAHLGFAHADRERGELDQARWQLRQADLNARAAAKLSPQERCAAAASMGPRPLPPPFVPSGSGPDPDNDGVRGDADRCPNEPEDRDGFADSDGCPDPDNDLDGVPDVVDRCPLQAGNGRSDGDGCPDLDADGDGLQDALDKCPSEHGSQLNQGCPRTRYRGLELTPTAIRMLEPVLFDDGTASIRSVSTSVLDAVVELLREHPGVKLEVQGHTDSQGAEAANLALSQQRAEAVVRFLVMHGVERSRLTARGYGETRPMESNRTSQGRAINRRIELVRRDGGT